MEFTFASADMERLYTDLGFDGGFGRDIVRAYRKCMQQVRSAVNEKDLYAFRSRRFERLKGKRGHQHSLRLNDQWRLIVEIRKGSPNNALRIAGIEDYH